jgi:hypothetical protein
VNSNGGAVHPLAAPHHLSGRTSLYLHLGMTGAVLETVGVPSAGAAGSYCFSAGGSAEPSADDSAADDDVEVAAMSSAEAAGFGGLLGEFAATPDNLPTAVGAAGAATGLGEHVRAWRDAEMDPFVAGRTRGVMHFGGA